MNYKAACTSNPPPVIPPDIHFTLGPACGSETLLRQIIAEGATSCRINLSHTPPDQLAADFTRLRQAAASSGRSIRIGADLRGRKLRIGSLPSGTVELRAGARFALLPLAADEEAEGGAHHAFVNCLTLTDLVCPGDRVLLDDGALELRVDSRSAEQVDCTVVCGGRLPERSGFNLPDRALDLPPLTAKDAIDIAQLTRLDPDFVYLSYVQTADDVTALKRALAAQGLAIPVVAKIERAAALENLTDIASVADALCLARGDLGVDIPLPHLPFVQREVVQTARAVQTPVLLAGEVLLSLVGRTVPARAELTDVVTALEQGFAGFVLSDETAVGCAPVAAVSWLQRIAAEISRRHIYR